MNKQTIKKISTSGLTREQWLALRRKSIGGSDAAAVMGISAYKSPYALWAEKTGKVTPADISGKEAVREGNDLEDYVAQRWTEVTGKKLRHANCMFYNSAYPYAHANVDRMVVGESAGFEAKTTTDFAILQQLRHGRYPDAWRLQMLHYMMVTGKQRWELGVLCFGKGFFTFTLERDEAAIAALAAAEERFWQHVTDGTPPKVDGSVATLEALSEILGSSVPETRDLSEIGHHVTDFVVLDEKIKALTGQQNAHKAEIMQFMGDAERGTYGDVSVSFKTQSRSSFDRKAFEAENGAIDPAFFRHSTTRPFKVSVRK